MKQLLSFVIPCYHSAETLPAVVEDIRRTVEADGRYDFEVILANDNPPDETWKVIHQHCQKVPQRDLAEVHKGDQRIRADPGR